MINDFIQQIFSHLCHQEVDRCWIFGGLPIAFCQRCTGVYLGAFFMAFILPLARFKPTKKIIFIHAIFILQMIIFGLHLIPHNGSVRTISGQIFIYGVIYFLWLNIQNRWNLFNDKRDSKIYFLYLILLIPFIQLLVHLNFNFLYHILNLFGLIGLIFLIILSILNILTIFHFRCKK